ncbi:MAG: hypothetical protein AABW73_04030 [Nanoarchaeota archaeon]
MGLLEGFATYDAGITKVLADWEKMGVFAYVLPFILIFAVTYAILEKIPVFKGKKGINLVVSLAIGLLSLQMNFVAVFFREIFPRAGIGLSVLLVSLILCGAFIDWEGKKHQWIFFGVGAVTFLFIIANAFSAYSGYTTNWWEDYGSAIVILILVITLIVLSMTMGSFSYLGRSTRIQRK